MLKTQVQKGPKEKHIPSQTEKSEVVSVCECVWVQFWAQIGQAVINQYTGNLNNPPSSED